MCQMRYGSGWSVKEVFSVACVRSRRSSSVHGRLFVILEMTRQEQTPVELLVRNS